MWHQRYLLFNVGPYRMAIAAEFIEQVEAWEATSDKVDVIDLRGILAVQVQSCGAATLIALVDSDSRWLVDQVLGIMSVSNEELLHVPQRVYTTDGVSKQAFLRDECLIWVVESDCGRKLADKASGCLDSVAGGISSSQLHDDTEQLASALIAVQLQSGAHVLVPLEQTERFVKNAIPALAPGACSIVQGVLCVENTLLPLCDPHDTAQYFWSELSTEQLYLVVSSRGEPLAVPVCQAGALVASADIARSGHGYHWQGKEYLLARVDNW